MEQVLAFVENKKNSSITNKSIPDLIYYYLLANTICYV